MKKIILLILLSVNSFAVTYFINKYDNKKVALNIYLHDGSILEKAWFFTKKNYGKHYDRINKSIAQKDFDKVKNHIFVPREKMVLCIDITTIKRIEVLPSKGVLLNNKDFFDSKKIHKGNNNTIISSNLFGKLKVKNRNIDFNRKPFMNKGKSNILVFPKLRMVARTYPSIKGLAELKIDFLYVDRSLHIEEVKSFKNLECLSIGNMEIDNLDFLKSLPNLNSLELSHCKLKNIDIKSSNLKELSIDFCEIENLSFIKNLTNLINLKLESKVKDISCLKHLIKLTSLSLHQTEVSDISPLQNLVKLQFLCLSYTGVSDISPLQNLVNLKYLDLCSCPLKDINALKNLVNLEKLELHFATMTDITALKKLVNLKKIRLDYTRIKDISPLQNLVKLEYLDLYNTKVEDVSFLKNLVNLKTLSLHNIKIKDVSFLKNLKSLENLDLHNTLVEDLPDLKNLVCLERLKLSKTKITDLKNLTDLPSLRVLPISGLSLKGSHNFKILQEFKDQGVFIPGPFLIDNKKIVLK